MVASRVKVRRVSDAERGAGASSALILIDVINGFAFPGSGPLVRAASKAAPRIARLAERAREAGAPVIYVNDNFGRWRSDFKATVRACAAPGQPGRPIVERLRPHADDYFVLKPQHSGFYSTALERLLTHLGARTLILTGFAANLCVVFTANDAHMRGYRLVVPEDCTASNTPALTRNALGHMRTALHADTRASSRLDFGALERASQRRRMQHF